MSHHFPVSYFIEVLQYRFLLHAKMDLYGLNNRLIFFSTDKDLIVLYLKIDLMYIAEKT